MLSVLHIGSSSPGIFCLSHVVSQVPVATTGLTVAFDGAADLSRNDAVK